MLDKPHVPQWLGTSLKASVDKIKQDKLVYGQVKIVFGQLNKKGLC